MMSATPGCEERRNDSEQHVHSWKWNHTTGKRGLVSSALVTCATAVEGRPSMAVIQAHAGRNSRRETPLDCACSQIVGREGEDIEVLMIVRVRLLVHRNSPPLLKFKPTIFWLFLLQ